MTYTVSTVYVFYVSSKLILKMKTKILPWDYKNGDVSKQIMITKTVARNIKKYRLHFYM